MGRYLAIARAKDPKVPVAAPAAKTKPPGEHAFHG
jgi:hypothetical protein